MVNDDNSLESAVINYIQHNYGFRKYIFWGPVVPVTVDMRLREDLGMIIEDAETMLTDVFEKFNIDPAGFDLTKYFNGEYFLSFGKKEHPVKTITVKMIVESAKAGRWLYD